MTRNFINTIRKGLNRGKMSNQQNDYILETFYEDFLEQGYSEKQAQKFAQEKFENEGWA